MNYIEYTFTIAPMGIASEILVAELADILHYQFEIILDTHSFRNDTADFLRKSPRPGFKLIVQNSLPLDLHVLGTPPAFILSQDQTLR